MTGMDVDNFEIVMLVLMGGTVALLLHIGRVLDQIRDILKRKP